MMERQPWSSGPGEILEHGLSLLKNDSDVNRRLAMISIDNSVELMIKTFLGLPKRITGIHLSRKEYDQISESFPCLIDAIEQYSGDKLKGIDLGEIEWFHRLRNQLYHQGNGLTVERSKVEIYSELAKLLFKNLFGIDIQIKEEKKSDILGEFMTAWVKFEKLMILFLEKRLQPEQTRKVMPYEAMNILFKEGYIDDSTYGEIKILRDIRNKAVHGVGDYNTLINKQVIDKLNGVIAELEKKL
ncbi:hypothetical protein [Ruminiclostridium papyrosolvens]|uniref:Uncharacterized protein n=1 Tax=Ruminiclostridium papyrosolvens C7 TaxID=1330534 RepID=U4QX03_9FIRM|nr:hypothetical protein [Ruminiclostridium papyrosolvens]EPR08078.1 hypothetical protein L323_18230 [Ruminiclostridium papyrosolvens C7]